MSSSPKAQSSAKQPLSTRKGGTQFDLFSHRRTQTYNQGFKKVQGSRCQHKV